jgi:hypothetical protein
MNAINVIPPMSPPTPAIILAVKNPGSGIFTSRYCFNRVS